jgi:3-deoxy-D-manno-octulosonic-acid transferase
MEKIWFALYNLLVIPFLYVGLRIGGMFNKKMRTGIIGRKRVFENLILNAINLDKSKELIWFHSSSLGEFEQAKPIIESLKQNVKINVLVTFFSPSGYENSKKYPHADLVAYIPFDTSFNAKKFIKIIKPSLAVMMRYDIWPNYIKVLTDAGIPVYLVDATMKNDSPRKYPVSKMFHKMLFKKFTRILTVSEEDAKGFKEFDCTDKQIKAVGDTRFDRVYHRSLKASEKNLLRPDILKNKKVIVAGSTWEADEEVLFPVMIKLAARHPELLFIITPHEPTLLHLEKIENELARKIPSIRFSFLNNYRNERVIIVDSIGILLTLYTYAHITFVGGSFKSNIHNVLEAAVYGIPVIYGPKIENSQEAASLIKEGGGIIVRNKIELYRKLKWLITDENSRKKIGEMSAEYVRKNLGATDKILSEILSII